MEYNFLADFLAKFLSLTPWVQAVVVIMLSFIPICFFYFLKQAIIKITDLISTNKASKEVIAEAIENFMSKQSLHKKNL
jgi:uncharacterized membrane protein YqhA